jgi:outer membrane protein assembly factor BamB
VFVGSTENRFVAYDVRTGKERWTWRTGGDMLGASADLKQVYYTALDAVLRAVNPGNGNQRWKHDTGTRPTAPPIALDGAVLVTGLSPALSAFASLTGVPLGTYELPGDVAGTPLVQPSLVPRAIAVAIVLKDGRAFGLRALTLLFNESPRVPLTTLPGKPLQRERQPEVHEPSASDGATGSQPVEPAAPSPTVRRPR